MFKLQQIPFFKCYRALALCQLAPLCWADQASTAFDMSLQELSKVAVISPATLTTIEDQNIPPSVTVITEQQINESGARSIDELLERYVPGLHVSAQDYGLNQLSNRGISGNEHFLLLVNGKTMNDRSQSGAITERDLSILGDIREIKVLRGSSAAIYGFGAVSMVIAIETHNSRTFEGSKLKLTKGVVDDYQQIELAHSHKWGIDKGLYLYGGLSDNQGASVKDSPVFYGFPGTRYQGPSFSSDNGTGYDAVNQNQNAFDRPAFKLHAQLDLGEVSSWARYERGGKRFASDPRFYEVHPSSLTQNTEVAYEQATFRSQWLKYLNEAWSSNVQLGYSTTEGMREYPNRPNPGLYKESWREEEGNIKVILRNTSFTNHAIAAGFEYSYFKFGLDPFDFPDAPVKFEARIPTFNSSKTITPWNTQLISGMFEHQWHIRPELISLLSWRLDKHSNTDWMSSPRYSLIYNPTQSDKLKFLYSKSFTTGVASVMESRVLSGGSNVAPEKTQSFELIWEHLWNKHVKSQLGGHMTEVDLLSWDSTSLSNKFIGKQQQGGIEFELHAQYGDLDLSLSHVYTQLMSLKLADSKISTVVSASPYGFGSDFNGVHNHLSKLNLRYQITPELTSVVSYVRYWGAPGSNDYRDYLEFQGSTNTDKSTLRYRVYKTPEWDRFSKNADYLNISLNWKVNKNLEFGVTGHYLLGLFDGALNKRAFSVFGYYREQTPAISMQASYKF